MCDKGEARHAIPDQGVTPDLTSLRTMIVPPKIKEKAVKRLVTHRQAKRSFRVIHQPHASSQLWREVRYPLGGRRFGGRLGRRLLLVCMMWLAVSKEVDLGGGVEVSFVHLVLCLELTLVFLLAEFILVKLLTILKSTLMLF